MWRPQWGWLWDGGTSHTILRANVSPWLWIPDFTWDLMSCYWSAPFLMWSSISLFLLLPSLLSSPSSTEKERMKVVGWLWCLLFKDSHWLVVFWLYNRITLTIFFQILNLVKVWVIRDKRGVTIITNISLNVINVKAIQSTNHVCKYYTMLINFWLKV